MKKKDIKSFRICVIGGGPAGMAAAWAAARCGAEVTLIERSLYLGGVLPQCIHTGFGTQLYGQDLTGGEYAAIWEDLVHRAGVRVILGATVMDVAGHFEVRYVDARSGAAAALCDAVILASGCTERSLPQMDIPGSRPAGIFTAGAAQRMMNLKNQMPGHSAVILGSGDIGLIMARRMKLEGIDVKMVLGEKATGLARNIIQCVEDFDIPLRYGWTVEETHGFDRLTGVTIRQIDSGRLESVPCDTLLVAAGLIPDRSLLRGRAGEEGLYICGNADHVHDLVDHVTRHGILTALQAVRDICHTIPEDVQELACVQMPQQAKGRQGNMICTVCPKGCAMDVSLQPFSVTGNECSRGSEFARQELSDPRRTVTTVMKAGSSGAKTCPVRTEEPVAKGEIRAVMNAARKGLVPEDAEIGQLIEAGGIRFRITGFVQPLQKKHCTSDETRI